MCAALIRVFGKEEARKKVITHIPADATDFDNVSTRVGVSSRDAAYFVETVFISAMGTLAVDGLGGANMHLGAAEDSMRAVKAVHRLAREGRGNESVVGLLDWVEEEARGQLYMYASAVSWQLEQSTEDLTGGVLQKYPMWKTLNEEVARLDERRGFRHPRVVRQRRISSRPPPPPPPPPPYRPVRALFVSHQPFDIVSHQPFDEKLVVCLLYARDQPRQPHRTPSCRSCCKTSLNPTFTKP